MNNISILILLLLLLSCNRENQDHPKMHSQNKVHAQEMVLIDTAKSKLDTTIDTNKPLKNGRDLKIIRSIYESDGDTINFYDIEEYYQYLVVQDYLGNLWTRENTKGYDSNQIHEHNKEVLLRREIVNKIGEDKFNYANLIAAGYIDEAENYKDIFNAIIQEEKILDELYGSIPSGGEGMVGKYKSKSGIILFISNYHVNDGLQVVFKYQFDYSSKKNNDTNKNGIGFYLGENKGSMMFCTDQEVNFLFDEVYEKVIYTPCSSQPLRDTLEGTYIRFQ